MRDEILHFILFSTHILSLTGLKSNFKQFLNYPSIAFETMKTDYNSLW